jgi:hypothetical protein
MDVWEIGVTEVWDGSQKFNSIGIKTSYLQDEEREL